VNSDHSEIAVDAAEPSAESSEKPLQQQEREPGQATRVRGSGTALALLALLLALAAAAGTGWLWWQDRVSSDVAGERLQAGITDLEGKYSRLSSRLDQVSAALDSLATAPAVDPLAGLDQRLSEDRAQVRALQESLGEQVALTRAQQQAVDALHARLLAAEAMLAEASGRELDARGELDLAEVDYLLRLASERLQLFSDIAAADRALSLADSNLAALDNPAYLGVRQAIANARGDLAQAETPDMLAISGQLDALQKTVPTLPFPASEMPTAASTPPADEGWWEKLKATFASLVTVRRSTEEENRRIGLLDQDFVRQRVWLQLEAAHLALMRREQQAFGSALQRVQETTAEWFDAASPAVQSFQSAVAALEATDITVDWPDISEPWAQLRLVRSARMAPAALTSPAAAPAGQEPAGEGAPASDEPPPDDSPDEGQ
jgi:uroporphyrin-3 C-methyltransferase